MAAGDMKTSWRYLEHKENHRVRIKEMKVPGDLPYLIKNFKIIIN